MALVGWMGVLVGWWCTGKKRECRERVMNEERNRREFLIYRGERGVPIGRDGHHKDR